MHPQITKTLDG